jgi:hypothetical protein
MANAEQETEASRKEATSSKVPDIVTEQFNWYNTHAGYHRAGFLVLKTIQILASAAIPILAMVRPNAQAWVNGVIGAMVLVIEGLQQLFQLQQNWTRYRSTCEGIRREQYLFLAGAGPYASATAPATLIVERMDALISAENKSWNALQEQAVKTAKAT